MTPPRALWLEWQFEKWLELCCLALRDSASILKNVVLAVALQWLRHFLKQTIHKFFRRLRELLYLSKISQGRIFLGNKQFKAEQQQTIFWRCRLRLMLITVNIIVQWFGETKIEVFERNDSFNTGWKRGETLAPWNKLFHEKTTKLNIGHKLIFLMNDDDSYCHQIRQVRQGQYLGSISKLWSKSHKKRVEIWPGFTSLVRRNGPETQQTVVRNLWKKKTKSQTYCMFKGNATKYWGNVCQLLILKE